MSSKNQTTKLVVNYQNSTAKTALDSNFKNLATKPRPPTYQPEFERNLNNNDSSCWNVKNPWLLRIVAVFSLIVTIVIFAALHTKLQSSFNELSIEVRELRFMVANFPEHIKKSLLLSLNNTDDKRGQPCMHFNITPGIENNKGIKEPKQEASGRDNRTTCNSSNGEQVEQEKEQTTNMKMSRRNTVYTRWGTTQCRTNIKSHTFLVYSGRVAASHYTHKGGGSNYLCLPENPFYSNPKNISEDQSAHLYPVKYGDIMEIFNKAPPKVLKLHAPEIKKKMTASFDFMDVPCAVCGVDGATSVLMIPARNVCPFRWERQYHGYLMSQKHDYGKSEFICVDVEAHGIPNTRNPNGDAFLHLTEFKCGSTSCRGYQQHKALSCSVCTT